MALRIQLLGLCTDYFINSQWYTGQDPSPDKGSSILLVQIVWQNIQ
jgi:hypothetical protein